MWPLVFGRQVWFSWQPKHSLLYIININFAPKSATWKVWCLVWRRGMVPCNSLNYSNCSRAGYGGQAGWGGTWPRRWLPCRLKFRSIHQSCYWSMTMYLPERSVAGCWGVRRSHTASTPSWAPDMRMWDWEGWVARHRTPLPCNIKAVCI